MCCVCVYGAYQQELGPSWCVATRFMALCCVCCGLRLLDELHVLFQTVLSCCWCVGKCTCWVNSANSSLTYLLETCSEFEHNICNAVWSLDCVGTYIINNDPTLNVMCNSQNPRNLICLLEVCVKLRHLRLIRNLQLTSLPDCGHFEHHPRHLSHAGVSGCRPNTTNAA